MFGYVRPLKTELRIREFDDYQAMYCGLCHTMADRYGFLARFTLNYDFTFLAMVLAPAGDGRNVCVRRCPAHPLKKCSACRSSAGLEVAADESLILCYCKLRDDVADQSFLRGIPARIAAWLLRRSYQKAARRQPEFDGMVRECLARLHQLEQSQSPSIDQTADTFARILQASAPKIGEETRDRALGQMLYHIGRWIYLVDAWDDLEKDAASGAYNPIALRYPDKTAEHAADLRITLRHSLNLAVSAYHLVDFGHWNDIIGNIIFQGLPVVEELVFQGKFQAGRRAQRRNDIEIRRLNT